MREPSSSSALRRYRIEARRNPNQSFQAGRNPRVARFPSAELQSLGQTYVRHRTFFMEMKTKLLKRTGQAWKLNLFWFVLFIVWLPACFGEHFLGFMYYVYCAGAVTLALGIASISIRCEVCGTRWLWLALKNRWNKDWDEWVLNLEECPICVPPPTPQILDCPRCGQESENPDFCDVCGKDLRPNPPPIVLPEKEERIDPIA